MRTFIHDSIDYKMVIHSLPQYVFTASELPSFFPIPQHTEMSFLPAPPRKLFFCCLEAPTSTGGETCLCDFKKVYDQMDPKVRQTFEEKGVSGGVIVILIPSPSPVPNELHTEVVSCPNYFSPFLQRAQKVWSGNETSTEGLGTRLVFC